ncbi:type III secretion system needle length determinant [Pseudomonas fluorescens]|nr:type III secretion system needle length determinant [Pseudomonas fluorescens]
MRPPPPARVAADQTRQAEFERALNHKPDAHEARRAEAARRLDSREPGKTFPDASRVDQDDSRHITDTASEPHAPRMGPEPETGTPDEPIEKDESVAQPGTEAAPTLPPADANKQQTVAGEYTERPPVAASQRENTPVTAKIPEPNLPAPPGTSASGPVADVSSEQHDSSGEQEQQPPMNTLTEEPASVAVMTQTPGDKLLARLLHGAEPPALGKDLDKLMQTLQLHIHAGVTRDGSTTLLQVNLAQLGQIDVQLAHSHGHLHVEIQASPGSLLQLQLARGDLMERLQRLNPGQPIQLTFNQHQQGSDQGSRQRRHVQDEWEQDT